MMTGWGHGFGWSGMGWGMGGGIVSSLLIVAAVAGVVVWMRRDRHHDDRRDRTPWDVDKTRRGTASAVEILNARYARGEISREEYQRMREEIET